MPDDSVQGDGWDPSMAGADSSSDGGSAPGGISSGIWDKLLTGLKGNAKHFATGVMLGSGLGAKGALLAPIIAMQQSGKKKSPPPGPTSTGAPDMASHGPSPMTKPADALTLDKNAGVPGGGAGPSATEGDWKKGGRVKRRAFGGPALPPPQGMPQRPMPSWAGRPGMAAPPPPIMQGRIPQGPQGLPQRPPMMPPPGNMGRFQGPPMPVQSAPPQAPPMPAQNPTTAPPVIPPRGMPPPPPPPQAQPMAMNSAPQLGGMTTQNPTPAATMKKGGAVKKALGGMMFGGGQREKMDHMLEKVRPSIGHHNYPKERKKSMGIGIGLKHGGKLKEGSPAEEAEESKKFEATEKDAKGGAVGKDKFKAMLAANSAKKAAKAGPPMEDEAMPMKKGGSMSKCADGGTMKKYMGGPIRQKHSEAMSKTIPTKQMPPDGTERRADGGTVGGGKSRGLGAQRQGGSYKIC